MALDPQLLAALACPEDRGPLLSFEAQGFLYNPRLRRAYRIEDDVPVLLVAEARAVTDAEHLQFLAQAAAASRGPVP